MYVRRSPDLFNIYLVFDVVSSSRPPIGLGGSMDRSLASFGSELYDILYKRLGSV